MVDFNYDYLIHGLGLRSEVELPLPRTTVKTVDIAYSIRLGSVLPPSEHTRTDDLEDPSAIEHWVGGRLAVEFPGYATFELSQNAVVLIADSADDPDMVVHLLLDHALPRVIALRGDLMLHASGSIGP